MNEVALLYVGNIEICPYMKNYIKYLEEMNIGYDVYFWEREVLSNDYPNNYFRFQYRSSPSKNKFFKIFDFYRFYSWIKYKKIGKRYKKIVCLDTLSAILFFLAGTFSSKYVIEVRDYSYENLYFFKWIEDRCMKRAECIFISSEAFREFLPINNKYIACHNFHIDEYEKNKYINRKHQANGVVKMVYVGSLKYFKCQKVIVDQLGNNGKFELSFHGYGPDYDRFYEYCKQYNNVHISGLFDESEKAKFYEEADFIINCYDKAEGSEVLFAVSNKYYEGLIYKIPQLVERDTYKGRLIRNNSLGIEWSPGDKQNLDKEILDYIDNMDIERFNYTCEELMESYLNDNRKYHQCIQDFLKCN